MSIKLNHTIVHSHDKGASAAFLVEILGLPAPTPFGPFLTVQTDNEVTLDFSDADRDFAPQHYAFLVSDTEFDEILGRIGRRGLPLWADPHHHRATEGNTHSVGRHASFEDPSGHSLESIYHP